MLAECGLDIVACVEAQAIDATIPLIRKNIVKYLPISKSLPFPLYVLQRFAGPGG